MTYEEYKQKVCDEVRKELEPYEWFTGVCTDTIPGSFRSEVSVKDAAETASIDTEMWDYRG